MNKTIGLVLLTLGIGLTAGYGAVLSPDFRKATLAEGQLALANQQADALYEAYCTSRTDHKLDDADGCGDSEPLTGTSRDKLAALDGTSEILRVKVTHARVEYRIALKRIAALEDAVEQAGTQGPAERLAGWQSAGGPGFLAGLLLLIAGAWICRRSASVVSEGSGLESDAADFGVLLNEVHAVIAALHADMVALRAPTTGDADDIKQRLEEVQKDALARLCASGPRVQARHGLQGMAALFSPLSAGERKLNRAWAALVDRHWPEALSSIGGAADDLAETCEALKGLG